MKNFKKHALVGLFTASTMFAGFAHAQTASVEVKGKVDVKLTILESCSITGGDNVVCCNELSVPIVGDFFDWFWLCTHLSSNAS